MELFSIMLDSCDATILKHLLNRDIGHVWIQSHMSDTRLLWWKADIPISPSVYMKDVEVRCPTMDIQMTTDRFLENIDLFKPHGLDLVQMSKKIPNGLWEKSIPESAINKVLVSNGMFCRFSLPHECEVAQFQCVSQDYVDQVSEDPITLSAEFGWIKRCS